MFWGYLWVPREYKRMSRPFRTHGTRSRGRCEQLCEQHFVHRAVHTDQNKGPFRPGSVWTFICAPKLPRNTLETYGLSGHSRDKKTVVRYLNLSYLGHAKRPLLARPWPRLCFLRKPSSSQMSQRSAAARSTLVHLRCGKRTTKLYRTTTTWCRHG